MKETIRRLEQQLPVRVVALQKSRALAAARDVRRGVTTNGPPSGMVGSPGSAVGPSAGTKRLSGGTEVRAGGSSGVSGLQVGMSGGTDKSSGGTDRPSGGTSGASSGTDGLSDGINNSSVGRPSGGTNGPSGRRPKAEVADASVQGLLSLSFSKVAGGEGLVVRFVASTTDAAYAFLREQLEPLTAQLGSRPYPT